MAASSSLKKIINKKKSEYHDRSGHIDSKAKEEVVSFVSQQDRLRGFSYDVMRLLGVQSFLPRRFKVL